MHLLLTVMAQASSTDNPAGDLKPGLEPSQVSPGLLGFIATFLLVLAVIFLVVDFNRRNRRLRYRAEYAERRAAEDHVGGYAQDAPPSGPDGARNGSDDTASPGPDGNTPDGTTPGSTAGR